MNANFYPALMAVLLAAPVGIALFAPFVAVQFRREGRLSARQLLQWAALLLYGIALWTYTLFPFPEPGSYACLPAQLSPLQFVADVAKYPYDSPGALLRNPAVAQVALNVALFIPLGVLVRLIWRRGIVAGAATGLLVSLAIELTQLTGLWGVYACAYRLFDVDDLLANTAGAVLGSLLSLVLRAPKGAAGATPVGPNPVTLMRRVVGIVCDLTVLWGVGAVLSSALGVWWLLVAPAAGGLIPPAYPEITWVLAPTALLGVLTLSTGRSFGDHATLVRWDGGPQNVILARALRFLCSAGPWTLVAFYLPPFHLLLGLTAAIVLVARRDRSGLPGLVARMHPVDSRADPANKAVRRQPANSWTT